MRLLAVSKHKLLVYAALEGLRVTGLRCCRKDRKIMLLPYGMHMVVGGLDMLMRSATQWLIYAMLCCAVMCHGCMVVVYSLHHVHKLGVL
jgi:hypothetical protein